MGYPHHKPNTQYKEEPTYQFRRYPLTDEIFNDNKLWKRWVMKTSIKKKICKCKECN